jgi:hypothetical protein
MANSSRRALILSYKYVSSAPRILKEIDWLENRGWLVDTLGLGSESASKGKHFQAIPNSALIRYLCYLIPSQKLKFNFQYESTLSILTQELLQNYDLLIIHDLTLLPHRVLQAEIHRRSGVGIQIDLHEDHLESLARNRVEALVFDNYRKWELSHLVKISEIPENRVSFTSVSERISRRFGEFLGAEVSTVRNAPRYQSLAPTAFDPGQIKLVHHGVGAPHRGIEASIKALKSLAPEFELHLLLLSSRAFLFKLRLLIRSLRLENRVTIHPPVKTVDIPTFVNQFDIALMVIPPVTVNEMHAMPNKFFESVQGCLAILTGPNPDLADAVKRHGLGVVADGWTAQDISAALLSTSVTAWTDFKKASQENAKVFSSSQDELEFVHSVAMTVGFTEQLH